MPKADKKFLDEHYDEINEMFKSYGLQVFVHFEEKSIVLYIKKEFDKDCDITKLNNYFSDLCNRYNYVNTIKIVNTKLFDQVLQPPENSIEFDKIKVNNSNTCQVENSLKP